VYSLSQPLCALAVSLLGSTAYRADCWYCINSADISVCHQTGTTLHQSRWTLLWKN